MTCADHLAAVERAARDAMAHDDAEAAAMRAHYAAPAEPNPYTPDTPDPIRDGLLRGWRKHMERRAR